MRKMSYSQNKTQYFLPDECADQSEQDAGEKTSLKPDEAPVPIKGLCRNSTITAPSD